MLISTIAEHNKYNQTLHQLTIFPQVNCTDLTILSHIIVSFRFRSIGFSKKRALAFFLAIELLTHHKCVASLSSRNIQTWKVRKGILVGCKVTLRKSAKNAFIRLLSLTFPRIEKIVPPIGIVINKLIKFNQVKNQRQSFDFSSNSTFILTLSELILFYPIELGFGLHPDVRTVVVNFLFSSSSIEERYFFLRQAKVPVSH